MNLKNMVVDSNSEDTLREKLLNVLASGAGLTHVRSQEVMRAVHAVRQSIITEGHQYVEWDVCHGSRLLTHENIYSIDAPSDKNPQILPALMQVWEKYLWWKSEATANDKAIDYIYTLVNPQLFLGNNPSAQQLLLELAHYLPESSVRLVFVTSDSPLPDAIASFFVQVEFNLPGHSELLGRLQSSLEDYGDPESIDVNDSELDQIAVAGAGMSMTDFDIAVASSIVDTVYNGAGDTAKVSCSNIISGVHRSKTEVIKRSDILELIPAGNMSDVGGLDLLKEWVAKREHCYSDEFINFGGQAPKGMVTVGVPGSGKSLVAKAVGNQLGIPIVRLDMGAVFNSLVGSSEERIRKALKLVEAMAPCVLFVDEIDKGLGGLGGSGDSGTSMRVFGTFLSWLQDNTAPVFTMVTANNVTGLPPELLRRGRFDQIFATTMPNDFEREDVLEIHLRKRGHNIDNYSPEEIDEFVKATDGCVAAEIESLVKDSIVIAFSENPNKPELRMEHILLARKDMVPLSVSHKDAIATMVAWAKDNATPASYSRAELSEIRKSRGTKKNTVPRKTRKPAHVTDIASSRTRKRTKKEDS